MKRWQVIVIIALVAAAGAAQALFRREQAREAAAYELAVIGRGDIEEIVSSSGTLDPVGTVEVLSQMSGRVEQVFADYNDPVTRGMVLVTLNTDMLEVEEQSARAAVLKAEAVHAHRLLDFQNKSRLAERQLIAEYDLHEARTSLLQAEADLASARASLERIQAELNQYARILSPIDGIVLSRDVEVGQSVVEGSSSNSASLFTLATDLSRMEIEAQVDELDISSIAVGQQVRFTVEAYPGRSFEGTVRQVRFVPQDSDGLVTYTVIISASNPEGKLLPGMTADVEFIVTRKEEVLLAPNAALRFQPASEARKNAAAARPQAPGFGPRIMINPGGRPRGMDRNSGVKGQAAAGEGLRTLWVLDENGRPAPRQVRAGVTDGLRTEIIDAADLEGRPVIVREKVN